MTQCGFQKIWKILLLIPMWTAKPLVQASCTELPLCFLFIQNNNQICFPFFRASPNLLPYSRASPMKVIKIPASGPHSAFQQQISSENASNMPPGVKVVKLSAASTMVTNQRVAYTSQVTIRFYFNTVGN